MAYIWETPATASLRVDVGTVNGEITTLAATGSKSVSFGAVDNTATFSRFIDGSADGTAAQGSFGLLPLFLLYLLGVESYSQATAKKTLTIGTEEAE